MVVGVINCESAWEKRWIGPFCVVIRAGGSFVVSTRGSGESSCGMSVSPGFSGECRVSGCVCGEIGEFSGSGGGISRGSGRGLLCDFRDDLRV